MGLAAPDIQLLLMAPDTSSPPKSTARERPGELPSLSSGSAGAPGRRLPGQGAQAAWKRVTSSRLTHQPPLPPATGDELQEGGGGGTLQPGTSQGGIPTLPLQLQGFPKPDCALTPPPTIIPGSTIRSYK